MKDLGQKGITQAVILILLLLGIAVGVYLVQRYTNFLPKAQNIQGASLKLIPSSATYNKGCDFSLEVYLDTGGADTDGTDAILLYDNSALSVISVENGSIYPTYPGNSINNTSGRVMISGLSSVSSPVNAAGKLATVNFKLNPATTVQSTSVKFDFDESNPSKTSDSNVVERGTIADVLENVTNAEIKVGSGSGCTGEPVPSIQPKSALSAAIDPNNPKKAVVSWSGFADAGVFDKIDLIYSEDKGKTQKALASWVYASTCTKEVQSGVLPKTDGSCSFPLPDKRENYYFKYYQDTATSNSLDISK